MEYPYFHIFHCYVGLPECTYTNDVFLWQIYRNIYNFPMDPMPGVYTEIQKQLKLADQIQSASNSARPVFFMSGQPDPP